MRREREWDQEKNERPRKPIKRAIVCQLFSVWNDHIENGKSDQ